MAGGEARRRPPIKSEAEVGREVVEVARACGVILERRNTGAALNPRGQMVRFGQPGDPDYEFTLPDGRRCAIEIKRPGKRPTAAQWHRINTINARNGVAFWIDDASQLFKIIPRLLAGARVEVDDDGRQWVTDEPIVKGVQACPRRK